MNFFFSFIFCVFYDEVNLIFNYLEYNIRMHEKKNTNGLFNIFEKAETQFLDLTLYFKDLNRL